MALNNETAQVEAKVSDVTARFLKDNPGITPEAERHVTVEDRGANPPPSMTPPEVAEMVRQTDNAIGNEVASDRRKEAAENE